MKRALLAVGLLGLTVISVLTVRTLSLESLQVEADSRDLPPLEVSVDEAATRLGAAISFPTVSYAAGQVADREAFAALHAFLEASYPSLHQTLEGEMVGEASLLFRWSGGESSLAPWLLLAHQDVVPVEPGSEELWEHPPFGGEVAGGFVWGRGALDDKASMMAILEAVEGLVERGWSPRRTLYLGFGHDEEVGGRHGAAEMAQLLRRRGERLEMVLDEGMVLKEDGVPGVPRPVALVGLAEKGQLNIALEVAQPGGHSSMPSPESPIGILAAAMARLEEHQMPLHSGGPVAELLRYLAPEMELPQRFVLANRWLFGGLVERRFAATAAGAAMMRTTTAPTIFQAGVKENVLARRARAVVNFRVHPADSIASVRHHVERVINDPRVEIDELPGAVEASPVSSADSPSYHALARTLREVFPEALVAPSLVLAATDSRHFGDLASAVYRFVPLVLRDEDLERIHGTDERIRVADYERAIRFYDRLLRNLGG